MNGQLLDAANMIGDEAIIWGAFRVIDSVTIRGVAPIDLLPPVAPSGAAAPVGIGRTISISTMSSRRLAIRSICSTVSDWMSKAMKELLEQEEYPEKCRVLELFLAKEKSKRPDQED